MLLRLGSLLLLFGLLACVACGRGLQNSGSNNIPSSVPAAASAQPITSTGNVTDNNVITVNAGSDTASVNVTVAAPAGTETAQALGNAADGFAANTGVIVHQASTETIVVFGTGLSANMTVTLSGPNDIGVSNIRGVKATNGTPGIAFDAVIGSSTAPGARTVYLKAPNNDITAFTGGLEVVP